MTLTPAQQRALAKLTDEWQSAGELRERKETMSALARRGQCEIRIRGDAGFMYFLAATWEFRRKQEQPK